jgi:hemolysin III
VGFVGALIAFPFLIRAAAQHGAVAIAGATIFAASMALLYFTSTIYHALAPNRAKGICQRLDHAAIYVLIAGTYTPFMLGALRGPWGLALLTVVWALAAAGILFKTFAGMRYPRASTILYLAMGWMILIAAKPLWMSMPGPGLLWLAAGGLAYTAGVGFYVARRRYSHFVWHLFVLTGTSCHFIAVLLYSGPKIAG